MIAREAALPLGGPCDVALIGAEIEESLGLRYLVSACARAGMRAVVIPFAAEREIGVVAAAALGHAPVLIGLSMSCQSRAVEFMRLARELRARGFTGHITAGGHFATLAAREVLRDAPEIDSCVRNEGEETLVDLIDAARRAPRGGRPGADELAAILGLALRDHEGRVVVTPPRRLPPPDRLPFPERSWPTPRTLGIATATVVGSRGCYAECSFCSVASFAREASGPRFRPRAVPALMDEIEELYRVRDVRVVHFDDDTFFLPSRDNNLDRLHELSREARRRGLADLSITLKCRPDDVHDEYFEALEPIGVVRVHIGIQSGDDDGLISLARGVTMEENLRALSVLRARGLHHTFDLLLVDPDSTMETIASNIDLLDHHADVPFRFGRTPVYAGTPLEARLRAERRLRGDYRAFRYSLLEPRADLCARLAGAAFHQGRYASDGVAAIGLQLRFALAVLARHHSAACDDALRVQVTAANRAVGRAAVRRLREIHAFASHVDLGAEGRIESAAERFGREVRLDDLALSPELARLTAEIEARASYRSG